MPEAEGTFVLLEGPGLFMFNDLVLCWDFHISYWYPRAAGDWAGVGGLRYRQAADDLPNSSRMSSDWKQVQCRGGKTRCVVSITKTIIIEIRLNFHRYGAKMTIAGTGNIIPFSLKSLVEKPEMEMIKPTKALYWDSLLAKWQFIHYKKQLKVNAPSDIVIRCDIKDDAVA